MGLLELISTVLPDFDFDGDIIIGGEKKKTQTIIIDKGGGEAVQQTDELEIIDVGEFNEEQRERAQDALHEEWESVEELFRESTAKDKDAIKSGLDDEDIEETLSYFRPIIPDNYVKTLEASLHMRRQIDMMDDVPPDWVRQRRKDIAEMYDGYTYQVNNLCSAGYFDEGRYLRELYEEMRQEEGYKEGDYAEVFEQIVSHRPFTIFVSSGQSISDVTQEIYSTLQDRERYDIEFEFVDIRGMGQDNRDKIRSAVGRIADEVGDFQVNIRNEEPELVMRIDPESVELPE